MSPSANNSKRLLDWSKNKVNYGPFDKLPRCRLCQRPAIMQDKDGWPCHKVCAEDWDER